MAKATRTRGNGQLSAATPWPLAPSSQAKVGPDTDAKTQVAMFSADKDASIGGGEAGVLSQGRNGRAQQLLDIASYGGNLIDLLGLEKLSHIASRVVEEYALDEGDRQSWLEVAERGLNTAAQEYEDQGAKDYPFEGASDIRYPLLTTAVQQFVGRASPELVKGDKACGFKVFDQPDGPSPQEVAKLSQPAPPMPSPDPGAQQAQIADLQQQQAGTQQAVNVGVEQQNQQALEAKDRAARGKRKSDYINYLLFYGMFDGDDSWEDDNDAVLTENSIVGSAYKKVYPSINGPKSEFVSAVDLVFSVKSKGLTRCPRITQVCMKYPYEIDQLMAQGVWRDIDLTEGSMDPQEERTILEQYRYEDLDGDGVAEPYIFTVDEKTRELLRVEANFSSDDVLIDENDYVLKIKRFLPYASYKFLPHPKRNPYGLGLAQLLDQIMSSVDTSINQLTDAGNAQIAGGGFIAANVRLPNAGQAGDVWIAPGEYQTVDAPGMDLRAAIYERTVPQPSDVTMKLLDFLLTAAKDVAAIKDVLMGDTPATAPVGTTFAVQSQALQVYSAIFKRIWRGFRQEFRLIEQVLKRYPTDTDREKYREITGGDLDEDFGKDDVTLQPVANPEVVTKIQKTSRLASTIQLAESAIGQAAGMTQAGPAQELVKEALSILDWDRPERFIAAVPPNPELVAKAQEVQAATQLKGAQSQNALASAALSHARVLREVGLAADDTQKLHGAVETMEKTGSIAALESSENSETGKEPSAPASSQAA